MLKVEVPEKPALVLIQRLNDVPFKRAMPRVLGKGVGEIVMPDWEEWKAVDKELEREL